MRGGARLPRLKTMRPSPSGRASIGKYEVNAPTKPSWFPARNMPFTRYWDSVGSATTICCALYSFIAATAAGRASSVKNT